MADRKISDLTALTTPASGDYLPIVDISEAAAASKNKRITIEELMRGVPDGTAAAPGIAFETDPNTGIYSPGANQLAVATNGVGRLFVDASGNVGVGTSSTIDLLTIGGVASPRVGIQSSTAGGDGGIEFGDPGDDNVGFIVYDHSVDALRFGVNASERLRITSAGLLGIGTSSPSALIDVSGSVNPGYIAEFINTGGSNNAKGLFIQAGLNNGFGNNVLASFNYGGTEAGYISHNTGTMTYAAAGGLQFNTNSQQRVTIASAGNVGIGSSAPTVPLDLAVSGGAGDVNAFRIFRNTDTLNDGVSIKFDTNGRTSAVRHIQPGGGVGALCFDTQGTERMRLTSTGLGIGTTTPGAKLSIEEETHIAGGYIRFLANASSPTGTAMWRPATDTLAFNTNSTERARIDSSGRLLIGTSTSAGNAKFEVTETRRLSATAGGSGWLELTDSAAVTSGVLTDIATVSITGANTCYFRLEVNAGHTGIDGYSGAVSIREGIISQYANTPWILNNAETRNLPGSINAGVLTTAVTTDVVTGTSGATSTLVFRATVTMTGSYTGSTVPRVSYRLSILSNAGSPVTAVSNI